MGGNETIRLWDAVTGEQKDTLTGHTDWVSSIAFSPDGRTLASAGDDTVRLWETVTKEQKDILTGHCALDQEYSVQPGWENASSWK